MFTYNVTVLSSACLLVHNFSSLSVLQYVHECCVLEYMTQRIAPYLTYVRIYTLLQSYFYLLLYDPVHSVLYFCISVNTRLYIRMYVCTYFDLQRRCICIRNSWPQVPVFTVHIVILLWLYPGKLCQNSLQPFLCLKPAKNLWNTADLRHIRALSGLII